eukprot:1943444-Prymnesium_polylepis.1
MHGTLSSRTMRSLPAVVVKFRDPPHHYAARLRAAKAGSPHLSCSSAPSRDVLHPQRERAPPKSGHG